MDRYDFNSTVSWGAILAGAFTAAAVTLIVVAFGVGAGLAVVSPWSGEGISATTASWAAGLFLVVVAMIASTFGGYITGRLRPGWEDVNVDERFFRDTAHGFVAWAFATVLTATCLQAPALIFLRLLPPARSRRREPAQPKRPAAAAATSISTGSCVPGRKRMAARPVLRPTRPRRGPNFSASSRRSRAKAAMCRRKIVLTPRA